MRVSRGRNINRSKVGQVIRISLTSGSDIAKGAIAAIGSHWRKMAARIEYNVVTNHLVQSFAKEQGFSLVIRRNPADKKHGFVPALIFKNEKALILFTLKWCYRD